MSARIEAATPIIKSYLKRHPVPLRVFDDVFQTLIISLWKTIKKQESTHQQYQLAHIFEYQARSDLKDEYYLKPFIRVPAKKVYNQEWKDKNMPKIFWLDDNPEDVNTFPCADMTPENEAIFYDELNHFNERETIVLKGRAKGLSFKEIGGTMGLKSEIVPVTIMKGIRLKLGTVGGKIK